MALINPYTRQYDMSRVLANPQTPQGAVSPTPPPQAGSLPMETMAGFSSGAVPNIAQPAPKSTEYSLGATADSNAAWRQAPLDHAETAPAPAETGAMSMESMQAIQASLAGIGEGQSGIDGIGQTVGGVAGAGIGAAVTGGNPLGAAAGSAIGVAAGSILDYVLASGKREREERRAKVHERKVKMIQRMQQNQMFNAMNLEQDQNKQMQKDQAGQRMSQVMQMVMARQNVGVVRRANASQQQRAATSYTPNTAGFSQRIAQGGL